MEKKSREDELSFDVALAELENIADQLNSGELGLEESIARYEDGMKLSAFCQKSLGKAERKIEMLQKKGSGVKREKIAVKEDSGEIENEDDIQGSLL